MDEGLKELNNASFFLSNEVSTWFFNQYQARNTEGLRLNFSVGDDFSFDIIDQPFHLTLMGKEDGILYLVHIRNVLNVSYNEDNADLSIFFHINGDAPTVKTSGRIKGDVTESFFRYLKIGVELKHYIVEHGLVERVSGLDTEREGILVEQQGESIILNRVKGKERPDLACVGFPSGIQMLRPYQDEAINALFAETTSFEENLKLAEDGDIDAMGEVAAAYFNGDEENGVKCDAEKAVYWFRRMAEAGSAVGQFNMGIQSLKGEGTEQNFEQALYWMQEAQKNGDPDAIGYVQQLKKIVELEKKANSGDAQAMADLASMLMAIGNAVGEDSEAFFFKKSIALATAAEKNNNPTAHYVLALAYENGRGVEKNSDKAVEHYKLGAQLGNVECKQNLGCCYLEGDSVPEDKEKGFALCMEAAKLGFGPAMRTVGRCYQFGNGVEESMKQAIFWYEKALEVIDDPELAQKVAIFKSLPDYNNELDTKGADNREAGAASIKESSGEALEEDIIQWFREKDTLISEKEILYHFSDHDESKIKSALKKLLEKGVLFGGPGVIINDLYGLDDSKSELKTIKVAAPAEHQNANYVDNCSSKSEPTKKKNVTQKQTISSVPTRAEIERQQQEDTALDFLANNPESTCAQVAEELGVTLHSATGILTSLRKKGQVRRDYAGKTPVYSLCMDEIYDPSYEPARGNSSYTELTPEQKKPPEKIKPSQNTTQEKKEENKIEKEELKKESESSNASQNVPAPMEIEDEETKKKREKYNQAVEIAKSNRIEDLDKAIEILEGLEGWNGSRKTIISCREKRLELVKENIRKEEAALVAIKASEKKNRRISVFLVVVLIAAALTIAVNAYLAYQREHPHSVQEVINEEDTLSENVDGETEEPSNRPELNDYNQAETETENNIQMDNTNNGKDTEAPKVVDVQLSTDEVKAPGEITVTVKASDDVSGVKWGEACFYETETETTLHQQANMC